VPVMAPSEPKREASRASCLAKWKPLSTAWIFPSYFQAPIPEETCFQHRGSSMVECTSQAILGSSDQWKVPASLSLFLKVNKSQLCIQYEKDPRTGPS
jgi:hypothetical protein